MRLLPLSGVLLLAIFPVNPVAANPVPPDGQSLFNGSELYSSHCAECHGWTLLDRYRQRAQEEQYSDPDYDFSDLVDQVQGLEDEAADEEKNQVVFIEDEEEWPEWAELPDPGDKASDPTVRAQIMDDLTAAIDHVYSPADDIPDIEESVDIEDGYQIVDPNGPIAGATELQKPELFFYGTSEQALYDSIALGRGSSMPNFQDTLESEEAIWDLVNFIRSFWEEEALAY